MQDNLGRRSFLVGWLGSSLVPLLGRAKAQAASPTPSPGRQPEDSCNYTYGYDQEGNETLMYNASVSWTYAYDNQNHQTSALETDSGGTTLADIEYKYDAFGDQVERDDLVAGTTTKYVLDAWNPALAGSTGQSGTNILAEINGSGTLITHYVWGDQVSQLFARYDAGSTLTSDPTGVYFAFTDQQGSVRDITDSTGTVVDSLNYDAYGNIQPGETNANYRGNFTYDGYHFDVTTGYYENHDRVYDPVSGRWLSQDPIGFAGGSLNLYQYVNDSPMDATDPSGLAEIKFNANGMRTIKYAQNVKFRTTLVTSKNAGSDVTPNKESAKELSYFVQELQTPRWTIFPWTEAEVSVKYFTYNGKAPQFGFDWNSFKEGKTIPWPPAGQIIGVNAKDQGKGKIQEVALSTANKTNIEILVSPKGKATINELYYYHCYSLAFGAQMPADIAKGRETLAGQQTGGWFMIHEAGAKAILAAEFKEVPVKNVRKGDILTLWAKFSDGTNSLDVLLHAAPVTGVTENDQSGILPGPARPITTMQTIGDSGVLPNRPG